jgi:hypothetical protein
MGGGGKFNENLLDFLILKNLKMEQMIMGKKKKVNTHPILV